MSMLTTYSALMLTQNQTIAVALITASIAALFLLAFVFGISSMRLLATARRKPKTHRSLVPLAVIFVNWTVILASAQWALKHAPADPSTIGVAMLSGLSAASLPLMFSLDTRRAQLNDETLGVGYWTLCIGMTVARIRHDLNSQSSLMAPFAASMNHDDSTLLQRFVEAFSQLDDSAYTHADPPADEFVAGIDRDDWNVINWRTATWQTSPESISAIRFAGRLPILYKMLALSYRWPESDLGVCRLLPNEPACDLQPLASAMLSDPVLNRTLISTGYARFAVADNYDPICFDLNRFADGDCPVVRLEHESILVHDSVDKCNMVFPTFRELMLTVVRSVEE